MNIITDYSKDIRHPKPKPGSYEWWYFDAMDENQEYSLVVIFYDGIPFSPRYNDALTSPKFPKNALAEDHPAISISLYKKGKPVFYSISEYPQNECFFSNEKTEVNVGRNKLTVNREGAELVYTLDIDEKLPSGDALTGKLIFKSKPAPEHLISSEKNRTEQEGHIWNLIQPRAKVEGELNLNSGYTSKSEKINLQGTGYHDHNLGSEPMKDEFKDWYWGRVSFESATLIYYIMNRKGLPPQYKAWLISPDNQIVLTELKVSKSSGKRLNAFLLKYATEIELESAEYSVKLTQKSVLDSGPFYLRFQCEGKLQSAEKVTEKAVGISEYIKPSRIHNRLFWPLINMRYRYVADEKPHWVQNSPRLYRWTW